jgi:DNA-directed RNA polymerase specialized sigma24 family protein
MVNTEGNPVFPEKSDSGQIAPYDDAYSVREGHFVGHDGFIVPNNFSEFYQRFPAYVADWVRRRVHGCASASEAEDWTQELLLHLAALPVDSIHRRDGKRDVIQSFSPKRMHGANEARFRSFINQCLTNRFNTIYRKWRQRPLSNPSNRSFDVSGENGASDEFCHSNSNPLRQAGRRIREREEHRFRLEEFVNRTSDAIPGLKDVFEFFRTTGNWEETAKMFGRRKCASIRCRARELGKGSAYSRSRSDASLFGSSR